VVGVGPLGEARVAAARVARRGLDLVGVRARQDDEHGVGRVDAAGDGRVDAAENALLVEPRRPSPRAQRVREAPHARVHVAPEPVARPRVAQKEKWH
jgi:hypothetical protein